MAARAPALAKLTRPKVYDAVQRPRLFALLDAALARPIVWISAPPGSGKSTLAASYLEARGIRHVWYQVDAGDADAATFIHYLRTALIQLAGKRAAALPLFMSAPQQNLAQFARGFFRDLFALLPRPSAIVLDNFHEARTTPEQRSALAQGFDEIPEGVNVIVVSRSDPPAEFARLVANRRIARIEAGALRCTADESAGILGHPRFPADQVRRIVEHSDGWVAALVLLREHFSQHASADESLDPSLDAGLGKGKDAIFQYFASEIFNGARPGNQRVLMLTSIPPSFTQAEAVALSGDDNAPRLLEYLFRRHLFVDRRRGRETTYHYHALFREFLHDELERRVPADERRALAVQSAALLAARGQVSEALGLYRDAAAFEPMHALIREHALEWARQGRAQALSDWIDALPAALRAADPWLDFWSGRAWIFVQPQRGRPALERAFAAFRAADDRRGQVFALATLVTGCYYEWADFAPLDRWLPEFARLLGVAEAALLDRESELRARAAYLIALLFRRPDPDALAANAHRLDELLDGDYNVNVRMMAASALLNYRNWKGEPADALVARIAPYAADPDVTPLMQVWWRTHLSFWHYLQGRYGEATAVATEARAIAERRGLEAHLFEIDHAEASAMVGNDDYAAARPLLQAIRARLSPTRRMDWAYFHRLKSMLLQRLGQAHDAVREAERAVALARETGLPQLQMPHFLSRLAQARSETDDRSGTFAAYDEAIALTPPDERGVFLRQRALAQVDCDIDDGNMARAKATLASELAGYRERGVFALMRNRPKFAARICGFALQHGIETEFVRTVIAKNALPPPPGAGAEWPFRLRIEVLGRFAIARDGVPLRFAGKAQQRPLDLLKLLIASGADGVDSQQLTAALWPDADGAAAKTSFDSTLFRLRKLLGVDNALALAGGKLSLDRTLAWTDLATLEALLAEAEVAATGRAADRLPDIARRLLEAWKGPLLAADEAPWARPPREMLQARFVRVLALVGEKLERRNDWRAATDLYRRGIEADNLSEPIYRGLMRSLAANGEHAEALNAYRRCRELLSIVLGIKPAAETEALRGQIAGATAAGTTATS